MLTNNVLHHQKLLSKIEKAGFSGKEYDWLAAFHTLISTSNASITRSDLLTAVLKKPQLFTQKPETLNAHVEASAGLLGLTKAQFTAAALKQPQLFCQTPETLNANVEESAALLGLTKAQLTAAALKQPPLFCQKPETLNANVEGSAALLGLTKAQFTALALKQPQLFYQKPETLHAKKAYIMKIAAALGETKDFAALIQNNPTALTNSKDYLDARYILAKLGIRRGTFGSLLKLPSAKASALLIAHYAAQIEKTGIIAASPPETGRDGS